MRSSRAPEARPTFASGDDIIKKHSGLIESVIRSVVAVHARGIQQHDLDDLRQAGRIGLDRARRRFDPNRGVALSTFAVPFIRNDIIDELKRLRRPLAPPGLAVEEARRETEHWAMTEAEHGRRAEFEVVERNVQGFVRTLPPRQAAVVTAIFKDELTQAQASRALQVSRPRVTKILREVYAKGRVDLAALAA